MGEKLKLAFQIYVDGFTAFRRCRMHPFVQKNENVSSIGTENRCYTVALSREPHKGLS